MIHVYEIPQKRSNGYCFQGGVPIEFINVDWMNSPDEIPGSEGITDEEMVQFIRQKRYFDSCKQYLLLFKDRALVIGGDNATA